MYGYSRLLVKKTKEVFSIFLYFAPAVFKCQIFLRIYYYITLHYDQPTRLTTAG